MKITNMKISKNEQETTITYDAATGEWSFYTSYLPHITLFTEKMNEKSNEVEVLIFYEGKPSSIRFKVEKASINAKKIFKNKRVMTERQLANLKNQL